MCVLSDERWLNPVAWDEYYKKKKDLFSTPHLVDERWLNPVALDEYYKKKKDLFSTPHLVDSKPTLLYAQDLRFRL